MCDAVAACHAQRVYHRDIKPENFIVTDGWTTLPDDRHERKVVVKLTDFGLSTTDEDSSDMDCGSAPYMSYGMPPLFLVKNSRLTSGTKSAETTLRLPIVHVLLMSGLWVSS